MPSNFFRKEPHFNPEVTHGICPTCEMPTMLVSLTRDLYRCLTCGSDLEQKIKWYYKIYAYCDCKK